MGFKECVGFNRDVYLMSSMGLVEDTQIIHKFGRNPSITSVPESIWDESTLYPWSAFSTPSTLSIVSTSDQDKVGGTGAYTMNVVGLDANFNWLDEVVNLNGLTPVLTTNVFARVFRMNVATASAGTAISGIFNLIITKEV